MGAKLLAVPFAAGLGYILYEVFVNGYFEHSILVIPLAIVLAVIYVLHPQINELWEKYFPQEFDPAMRALLIRLFPAIHMLEPEKKVAFEKQIQRQVAKMEFTGMELNTIPHDVQYLIAATPTFFNLLLPSKIWKEYPRVVLYPHPFLSPRYRENVHIAETHHEDGVLIFSLEQLLSGFNQPSIFPNAIVLEWAKIQLKDQPVEADDQMVASAWSKLEQAGLPSKEQYDSHIGLHQDDVVPVLLTYFLTVPGIFTTSFPDWTTIFKSYLGIRL